MKYKDLPLNVTKAGPIVIIQIPEYATGMGTTLEEAAGSAMKGFLAEFFRKCATEKK